MRERNSLRHALVRAIAFFLLAGPLITLTALLPQRMVAHADEAVGLVDQLTNEVMCQCGCSYTVNACAGAMQCDVSEQMRGVISEKVGQGQSRAQIVAYFTSQYGEKVLSAPTKQGFNLTAWVTPFAAIIAGAAAVYLIVQAWVRRRSVPALAATGEAEKVDLAAYGARVDRDLDQFI